MGGEEKEEKGKKKKKEEMREKGKPNNAGVFAHLFYNHKIYDPLFFCKHLCVHSYHFHA